MEPQHESSVTPPSSARISERGKRERERIRAGRLDGKIEGFRAGELQGKRDALLRVVARAGIVLDEGDRLRIHACRDAKILNRWVDNAVAAKTASDVLA